MQKRCKQEQQRKWKKKRSKRENGNMTVSLSVQQNNKNGCDLCGDLIFVWMKFDYEIRLLCDLDPMSEKKYCGILSAD